MSIDWDVEKAAPKGCRVECFLKRDQIKKSMFYLYLENPPSRVHDKGQFVLAAKQLDDEDANTGYLILSADEFSEESCSCIGEVLQPNHVGTKFKVHTRQLSPDSTVVALEDASQRQVAIKQVSPAIPAGFKDLPIEAPPISYSIAHLAHEFNFCCINACGTELIPPRVLRNLSITPPSRKTPEKGAKGSTNMPKNAVTDIPTDHPLQKSKHVSFSRSESISETQSPPKAAKPIIKTLFPLKQAAKIVHQANFCGLCICQRDLYGRRLPKQMKCTLSSLPIPATDTEGSGPPSNVSTPKSPKAVKFKEVMDLALPVDKSISKLKDRSIILRTKTPKWLEKDQCLCLIFRGRATIDSTKNFQLAVVKASQAIPDIDPEQVVLQFGKVGKDKFTMDYCHPLSTVLAFAICLSTFSK